MWLSLVERLNGVQEAASSILVTPTDMAKIPDFIGVFAIFVFLYANP